VYLEIDEGYFEHPKTLDLCSRLQDSKACVYPLRLWKWACRSAKSGKLGKISAFAMEKAVDYEPMDGKCFDAMCLSGFMDTMPDGTFEIHDWMNYTGGALKRMEDKAAENRRRREEGKKRYEAEQERQRTGIVPAQSENHTGINLTQTRQDQTRPVQTRQDQSSDQKENSRANPEPAPLALEMSPSGKRPRTPRAYTEAFETAWKGYVRGEGKAEAFAEWQKLAPSVGGEVALLALVQRAMEWQRPKLARDGGKFAVHFCRWLKHRRWEDEPSNGASAGGGLTPEQIANGSWRTQCKPES
jgi:hypothetical protein